MKPNLVIGNPPYDKDIYLDFVTQAHNLSQDSTVMITPAKWQAKAGKKNEDFRDNIVPYMRDIVYYPDTTEVFNISSPGGISYYLLSKFKCEVKNIKSVCANNALSCSGFEPHDETMPVLFNNTVLNIVGKVGTLGDGFKQSLYVKNIDRGEATMIDTLGMKRQTFVAEQERGSNYDTDEFKQAEYVEVMQGESVCGYKRISDLSTTVGLNKYKITTSAVAGNIYLDDSGKTYAIVPCNILKPYQVPKGSYPVLRYFDSLEECESFKSYYSTTLVAFLFYCGACGTTLTREFFRYIPDPQDWTVIYEDKPLPNYTPDTNGYYIDTDGKKHCSLYVKYNLTPDEIDLIESVIKTRTKKA